MFLDILITLIMNVLILLSMSIIYSMFPFNSKSKNASKKILFGIYIGVTGIALMSIPFDFNNGVFFDTRSILMSSSGIFLGLIPTIIGGIMQGIYRIYIGGVGTFAGVAEIVISASIGLLYRYHLQNQKEEKPYNIKHLLQVAFVTQVLIFSLMFTLPKDIWEVVLPKMWFIILFVFPPASVLVYQFHIKKEENIIREDKLKLSELQYRNLFENSHVVLMVIDGSGKIVDANKTALEFYGWSIDKIKTLFIQDINTLSKAEVDKEIENCLQKKKDHFNFKHRKSNGDIVDVEVYSGPIVIDGTEYILSTIIDSTAKIKNEKYLLKKQEELTYVSHHDFLTGLYNRFFFEEELKRLNTKRKLPMSIILGDLNDLKVINDTFSHIIGDELINEVASILKTAVREEDIVSRWGGDEFAILLPNTDRKTCEKVIRRIEKLCSKSKFQQILPSIALGYDTKTSIEMDSYESLKLAEKRMYKNKRKMKLLKESGIDDTK